MKSQSLLYIDSARNRLTTLIGNNMAFSFVNLLVYKSETIYQVKVVNGVVSYHTGNIWNVTNDEDLMCELIVKVQSKEIQKKLPFKEAV